MNGNWSTNDILLASSRQQTDRDERRVWSMNIHGNGIIASLSKQSDAGVSLGSCHLIVSIMAGLRFLVCKEKRNVVSPDTFFDVCFLCQNFGSQVCYKRCSSDTLVSLSTISFDDLVLSCLGYQHLFIYGYIFVTICGARLSARSSLSNCSSTRRERSK